MKKVNTTSGQIFEKHGFEFIEALLQHLNITVEVDEDDLKKIPGTGAFITVSNHPFGALDALLLSHIIGRVRPDYKVLANELLRHVEQVEDLVIPVSSAGIARTGSTNYDGVRKAVHHMNDGHPLGIFPAGDSVSDGARKRSAVDRPWQESAIKLIQRSNCPVVPVYFDGENSKLFNFMDIVDPSLGTLAFPSDIIKRKGRTIRVRFAKAITASEIDEFRDREQLARFLRARTYALGSALHSPKKSTAAVGKHPKQERLIKAVPEGLLHLEVEQLFEKRLFSQGGIECYLADAEAIPNLLREISRLREMTFREVDEGTGKSCDTDEYDSYYKHLFLWDTAEKQLVGSYRIGMGADIMAKYGRRGFYISTLFMLEEPLDDVLKESIELGRSFICSAYQKHRLPLFMLWQGILSVLISHPGYRYVLGPVSISNHYQELSRGLMVEFVRKHYFNKELAQHVKARHEYTIKSPKVDHNALLNASSDDMRKLDKIISDIEPSSYSIPILLKKYLQQNARIIGFNRDPQFSDALDGLMILDLNDVPESTIENLKKGLEDGFSAD